jgi:hypothetical protein
MGLHTTLRDVHIRAMRVTPRQRQLERLAWAGGLFDGEGSTMARGETSRPGYRRLNVAVSQHGERAVPEVLTRFTVAMNRMGTIGRPFNDVYQWRVADDSQARATAALLRPWIGPVKRRQAARAIAAVDEQYSSGRVRGRPWRRRAAINVPRVTRGSLGIEERRRLDRAWAAGFLDGEGCFGLVRANARLGGPDWYRIRASATQRGEVGTPAAVLRRLHRIVGVGRIENHGEPDTFKWVAEGIPALERTLQVVSPWLGLIKRHQAREAMASFTRQVRLKGPRRTHCKRGHIYDRRVTTKTQHARPYCNACARLCARRIRAAQGIKPRQFKDERRRYTE